MGPSFGKIPKMVVLNVFTRWKIYLLKLIAKLKVITISYLTFLGFFWSQPRKGKGNKIVGKIEGELNSTFAEYF